METETTICPDCVGQRKIYEPNEKDYIPCASCQGDGTISKTIGETTKEIIKTDEN